MAHFYAHLRYSDVLKVLLCNVNQKIRVRIKDKTKGGGIYINTTTSAIGLSSRRERTAAALHRSPQNNAFGAIAVRLR